MRLVRPRRLPIALAGLALVTVAGTQLPTAFAASADKSVTLPATPGSSKATFTGHAPFNSGQANILFDDATGACNANDPNGGALRDSHTIEVKIPQKPASKYDVLIRFQIDWTAPAEPLADMRLDLFGPDHKLVASSDSSQFQEGINLTAPVSGVFTMVVCAFQTGPTGQDYTGTVTARTIQPPSTPLSSATKPTYKQFSAPKGISTDAGEPSIGNNWKSGKTFFTSNVNEYNVAFNDSKGTSTWTHVNTIPNASNVASFDPIGFTDSSTGRTFVSQLFLVCSGTVYTDNDFATVSNPSVGCGSGINGFDHQTIGGGPFPKGMSGLTSYSHAVYYCSQAQGLFLGDATCARSDDGGITFGQPVNVWNGACSGLHGHVRVAPDGTAYLPNANCAGKQGVGVSTNGGQTWVVHQIPDSVAGSSDPSVSAGKDGTVYYGYSDGTGRAKIAVSRDRGKTWTKSAAIGTRLGIRNSEFAEVIAGDGTRAAFAFLGTSTPGSTQAASFGKSASGATFTGAVWHMFIATTYDRGKTWSVVDSTPHDPVQRGCVWNGGGSNDCRNLLDFNDITIDKIGRVMVGFADGCVSHALEPDNSVTGDPTNFCTTSLKVSENGLVNHGAIIRQQTGKTLFAAYDGTLPNSGSAAVTPTVEAKTVVPTGSLATTGATPWVAGGGALLVLAGLVVRGWRRRTTVVGAAVGS